MRFHLGTDRVAVVFPLLHIAIKFPIVRVWRAVRLLYRDICSGGWKQVKKDWGYPMEMRACFRGLLFRGFAANWGEFRFWWQTRHPFVQPTFISFFGLFNVQRADAPCLLKREDVWVQLYRLTQGKVFADAHHFAEPGNFCFRDGKLRMHDYGGRACQGVIVRYGASIVTGFDPAYRWEAENVDAKRTEEKDDRS
ncbi:MAG: hypothetical protein Q7T01_02305 [bacterium]|nr:hypothetical protein [bacterium]